MAIFFWRASLNKTIYYSLIRQKLKKIQDVLQYGANFEIQTYCWVSFVQAFGGETSDSLKTSSQKYICQSSQFSIHNMLFGIFRISIWQCSTSYLTLFSIWLSHGSEFKSLVILLKFCLCLCHFIIVRTLHLNFSKFWQIIWNCISVIWVDKKNYIVLCFLYIRL